MKPFRETKAFEIIKKVAPHLIKGLENVIPGGSIISGIIDSLKKEGTPLSLEEMNELYSFEREMYEMEIQSVKNAQDMNVAVNESEYASWLTKNVAAIIALAYTAFNFVIYVMILVGTFKVDTNIAILIVNSITNIAMLIVGFYFGSSNRHFKAASIKKVKPLKKAA